MPVPVVGAGNSISTPSFVSTTGSKDYGNRSRYQPGDYNTTGSFENSQEESIIQEHINPYATNYAPSYRINTDTTIPDAPCVLIIDATSANITITLPSPRAVSGKTIVAMRADNTAARTITVNTAEGNVRTTASVSSILGTQYGAIDLTASCHLDSAGTGEELVWIGR